MSSAPAALPSCNDTKERLSLAYLRAVAARCRSWVAAEEGGDYASLDAMISSALQPRRVVGVQLKCTSVPLDRVGADIAFDLPVNNYDALRRTDTSIPQILVVQELPSSADDWLSVSPENLVMRRAAWWADLWGAPATENTATVRIRMPLVRQFNPQALTHIFGAMAKIAAGETRKPLHEF